MTVLPKLHRLTPSNAEFAVPGFIATVLVYRACITHRLRTQRLRALCAPMQAENLKVQAGLQEEISVLTSELAELRATLEVLQEKPNRFNYSAHC